MGATPEQQPAAHDFSRGVITHKTTETVSTVLRKRDHKMSHSLTRIWIHSVFGTKNRQPLLKDGMRENLFTHIREEIESLGGGVRIVNGTRDHIHVLFLLPKELSIAQIMKSIKGGSSHWVNQGDMISVKFAWQVGYGGFSVSESIVSRVEKYIQEQEKHHRNMSFVEEYEQLMKNHNLHINH